MSNTIVQVFNDALSEILEVNDEALASVRTGIGRLDLTVGRLDLSLGNHQSRLAGLDTSVARLAHQGRLGRLDTSVGRLDLSMVELGQRFASIQNTEGNQDRLGQLDI